MVEAEFGALVLDVGSSTCRAGFAGHDTPGAIFPSVVLKPRTGEDLPCLVGRDAQEEEEATQGKGKPSVHSSKWTDVPACSFPVECGVVTDWDAMEEIWKHLFSYELDVDHTKHPVLLTEAPLNPKANRERTIEIMFQTFDFPAVFVAVSAVLSLRAAGGRRTGLVLDSGDAESRAVPVYEGFVVAHGVQSEHHAGRDVTERLTRALEDQRPSREAVREVKERFCSVALNYKDEEQCSPKRYRLMQGCVLTLGSVCLQCAEVLFRPDLMEKQARGIHQLVDDSILLCEVDLRSALYSNVVLAGGSTLFPGLCDRLARELNHLTGLGRRAPGARRVEVIAPPDRRYSAWKGGSSLARDSDAFRQMCVSREEFDELSAKVVHSKCF